MDLELARLRRRDPDAVGAFIERYQFRLYRYLLRLVRDPATAEDLFQQTWLRVVEKIRRYDARRSFEAWLFAVAHNLAIDHLRKRRLESLDEPAPIGETPAARLPAGGEDALTTLLAAGRLELVVETMAKLPAVYREVLTLRFEEEMKLEEIAEVAGAPVGTVKSRLRRALEALRKRLAGGGTT
ncbi:MAG: sigma-70 family RNA polymerase sigma factor [bacterium]|nr:sigma-70 family RNA polymerase sigma factor [bacterium]